MKERVIKFFNSYGVNTRTQEEYDVLMQYLEWLGFLWSRGEKPTELNFFKALQRDTFIEVGVFQDKGITYTKIEERSRDVIWFETFEKEFISEDMNYQLYLAKQKVEQLEKEIKEGKEYYVRLKDIGKVNFYEHYIYLNYYNDDEGYSFGTKSEASDVQTKFTKKELIELKIWDNDLFYFEEV